MKILSHRGYWKDNSEKNTACAFNRSFSLGLGTETDIRDFNRELVISHDMATGAEMDLISFLSLASSFKKKYKTLVLALNVKADGLALPLRKALEIYPDLDCFVFDMSIPDMSSYFELGIPVFSRMSEVEKQPVWLDRAAGVWLDSFESDWFDASVVKQLLDDGKRVCVVSPELHRRSYLELWGRIKPLAEENNLLLCTDHPEQAVEFFLNYRKDQHDH